MFTSICDNNYDNYSRLITMIETMYHIMQVARDKLKSHRKIYS